MNNMTKTEILNEISILVSLIEAKESEKVYETDNHGYCEFTKVIEVNAFPCSEREKMKERILELLDKLKNE